MTAIQPTAIVGRALTIYKTHAAALIAAGVLIFAIDAAVTLLATGALLVLSVIVAVVAQTFYTGMVVRLVDDVRDGVLDSSIASLFKSVAPVAVPLFLASLLTGIGIALGFVLLIVPGLFLMTIWAVVAPVVVLEQRGVIDAIKRSQELVRGNGWPVFGVIVLVLALTVGVGFLAAAITSSSSDAVQALVQWIVTVLLSPVAALATAVLYFALRGEHA